MTKMTKKTTSNGSTAKRKPSTRKKEEMQEFNHPNIIANGGFKRRLVKANLVLPTGLLVATTQDSEENDIHVCLLQHNIVKLRPNHTKVKIIESLISKKECAFIIKSAENYAAANGGWTSSRHTNYATTDIPVDSIFGTNNHVDDMVSDIIFPQLAAYFNLDADNLQIGELFIAKYEFKEGQQSGLVAHADGTPWSFVIALNDPTEFTGGGTHFIDTNVTIRPKGTGAVALFCGKNVHEGVAVTSGVRYIMAGFCNYMNSDVSHEYYLSHYDMEYDGSAGLVIQTGDLLRGVYVPPGAEDAQNAQNAEGNESESEHIEYITSESDIQAILGKGLKQDEGTGKQSLSVLIERMDLNMEDTNAMGMGVAIDVNEENEELEQHMISDDTLILDMIRNVDLFVTVGEFWKLDAYCNERA